MPQQIIGFYNAWKGINYNGNSNVDEVRVDGVTAWKDWPRFQSTTYNNNTVGIKGDPIVVTYRGLHPSITPSTVPAFNTKIPFTNYHVTDFYIQGTFLTMELSGMGSLTRLPGFTKLKVNQYEWPLTGFVDNRYPDPYTSYNRLVSSNTHTGLAYGKLRYQWGLDKGSTFQDALANTNTAQHPIGSAFLNRDNNHLGYMSNGTVNTMEFI